MGFFVRTGNSGTDPDFTISDLDGIVIISSASWFELSQYDDSNFTNGQFTPSELTDSEDLYDAVKAGQIEVSTDGINNIPSTEYTIFTPLSSIILESGGGLDLSGSRLVVPVVASNSFTDPSARKGELIYHESDGYLEVYTGSQWEHLGSGGGSGATQLNGLSDVNTVTTVPYVGAILGYDGYEWVPIQGEKMYNKEIDEVSGGDFYIGEALPGTLTSEAGWRIQFIDFTKTGPLEDASIRWQSGVSTFTAVWDDRLGLTYS